MKRSLWVLWALISFGLAGYYGYILLADDDKSELLIGPPTHGHFQIEMACTACHTEPFGGTEVLQDACMNCHEQELEQAHDSHPKKKFNDPRNADRLEIIDARFCVSCHTEHQQEQTQTMGVTLPDDYCFHCHKDVGQERASHKDLEFDSCASAGCHNYHDNRALYENFLVDNSGQPWLAEIARIGSANAAHHSDISKHPSNHLSFDAVADQHPRITEHWAASSHADAGVSCGGCHSNIAGDWIEKPGVSECQSCHKSESEGFLAGKHGMRLAQDLPAMSPAQSSMPFKPLSQHVQQGCTSCHQSHKFDAQYAAQDACLSCHNDDHSQAFTDSPHGQLAKRALLGEIPAQESVTCATCHMPRIPKGKAGTKLESTLYESSTEGGTSSVKIMGVEHNQNLFLRPNEKMIRPVCMQCHSLEFSIDALADDTLIKSNFSGKPERHIPSVDWANERAKR